MYSIRIWNNSNYSRCNTYEPFILTMKIYNTIEKILFNNYPFYMAYIQEYGFVGAVARLNMFYQKKK